MLSYSREQDRAGENMFNIKQFFYLHVFPQR